MEQADTYYKTKYGCLSGISSPGYYPDGSLMECDLNEELVLDTPQGAFIPQYTSEGVRKKYIKALTLYPNGNLKRLYLEHQMPVKTLLGDMKAELLTFYEAGGLKRVFPLNGKISGYWTEDNEYELAESMSLELSFGKVEKKLISVHFYEKGNIKSLTLWPKDFLMVPCLGVKVKVRFGIAFYPDGMIKSLEPAYPLFLITPIGRIAAFDINANGINGDDNSLNFYEDGRVRSLVTSTDRVKIKNKKNGEVKNVGPTFRPSIIRDEDEEVVPVTLIFFDDRCCIDGRTELTFAYEEYSFEVENMVVTPKTTCSDCSSCQGSCDIKPVVDLSEE